MQYIHLNDDSYILHTSKGMTTLTRKTFNFHTIKSLVKKGKEECDILPLLETPDLPNGIFELYLNSAEDKMLVKHTKNDEGFIKYWNSITGNGIGYTPDEDSLEFMGIYACEQDYMADWPEYLI